MSVIRMTDPAEDLVQQLRVLGCEAEPFDPGKPYHLHFPYVVPVGRFRGEVIRLGLIVPPAFPRPPPSGPHLSPRLIGQHGGGPGGVHNSDFGPDWEYWSRPYQNWGRDGSDANAYMAFVRTLLATI